MMTILKVCEECNTQRLESEYGINEHGQPQVICLKCWTTIINEVVSCTKPIEPL